jgi:hypothetical protein
MGPDPVHMQWPPKMRFSIYLLMTPIGLATAAFQGFIPDVTRKFNPMPLFNVQHVSTGVRRYTCAGSRSRHIIMASPSAEWQKYAQASLELPLSPKRQPDGPLQDDPSLPMIEDIIKAADDRKAQNIWASRVSHLTYTTEFFVNVQGTSRPMLQVLTLVCLKSLKFC